MAASNPSRSQLIVKRAFDIVASVVALVVLSPLLAFVSLAIKVESSGPVFSVKNQYWHNSRVISVLRFRCTKRRSITMVGRVLILTGIETVPMLINVLLGDMSIVGLRRRSAPRISSRGPASVGSRYAKVRSSKALSASANFTMNLILNCEASRRINSIFQTGHYCSTSRSYFGRASPKHRMSSTTTTCVLGLKFEMAVPTLAELRQHSAWFWLYCEKCLHSAPVAFVPLMIRWGGDASSDKLRQCASELAWCA